MFYAVAGPVSQVMEGVRYCFFPFHLPKDEAGLAGLAELAELDFMCLVDDFSLTDAGPKYSA